MIFPAINCHLGRGFSSQPLLMTPKGIQHRDPSRNHHPSVRFLTAGVTQSKFCQMEMRWAIQADKNIIMVSETAAWPALSMVKHVKLASNMLLRNNFSKYAEKVHSGKYGPRIYFTRDVPYRPLKRSIVYLGCYETWRWHIPNAPETKQSHPV